MRDNERYLYEIRPIKPIKDLIPDKQLMKACSMHLTKDEVLKCLSNATIWRKFPGRTPIKVTGENLDRLHKKNFCDVTNMIPQADIDFFRDNIEKVLFNPYNGEITLVDKSGPNKEFTAKYKDKLHTNSKFAFVDGVRGIRIPVETVGEPDKSTVQTIESDNKKDFLSENEEESSAPIDNSTNSSSNNKNRKNKINRIKRN